MTQDNFVNSYIEILNATVTEAIQKNLVLQTQKKVAEQNLEELKKVLETEKNAIAKLRQDFYDVSKQRDKNASEANEHKKNSEHIETFKNELLKCRKNNEELLIKIESLKIDLESKNKSIEELKEEISKLSKAKTKTKMPEKIIQDSGKF